MGAGVSKERPLRRDAQERVNAFVQDFCSPSYRAVWSSQCSTPMTFNEFCAWMNQTCPDCGTKRIDGKCDSVACRE